MLKLPLPKWVLDVLAGLLAGVAFVFPDMQAFLIPLATFFLGASRVETGTPTLRA